MKAKAKVKWNFDLLRKVLEKRGYSWHHIDIILADIIGCNNPYKFDTFMKSLKVK